MNSDFSNVKPLLNSTMSQVKRKASANCIEDFLINNVGNTILDCTKMSDVEPKKPKWLFEPYIPISEVTLIEGDPECGKSWLAMAIASSVSHGTNPVTGETVRSPAPVLFLSCEDSIEMVQAERFKLFKANQELIISVEKPFVLDSFGFESLENTIVEHKPMLVVLNPLQAYVGGYDLNRMNEARPILNGLNSLAKKFELAILGIRHLNKGSSKSAYRGAGSIDIRAAARSVLIMGKNPKNKLEGAIFHSKSNLSENGSPLGYTIDTEKGFQILSGTKLTIADIAGSDTEKIDKKLKIEMAEDWIKKVLNMCPIPSKDFEGLAEDEGISLKTLERARKNLGVESFRDGQNWAVRLPQDIPKGQYRQI